MVTLRIVRHDRTEQLLAECESTCLPSRGEALQLDTLDADGIPSGPSTLWRVVAVTMHVPSRNSDAPVDGSPLRVRTVEVSVLPDVQLEPHFEQAARNVLTESRM